MYFATRRGRSQALDFLHSLPARDAAYIQADIVRVAEADGRPTVVSVKPIKGGDGVCEIRTFGYRALYIVMGREIWLLHVCRKQDQRRGIELAKQRARELKGA